jgi:peptidoglycan/LPS O-acetylase OafA/YrhL
MQEGVAADNRATPRFDAVDVLRGLSILAVILLHGYLRLYLSGHSIRPLMPRWLMSELFFNGGNGVTVFFAVSGFLITYTSLRRFGSLQAMRPSVFYRVRIARIAPLLLLVLAILSVLHLAHAEGFRIAARCATLPRALLAALTFHLNWLESKRGYLPANWDVMWSLSIEEMFYLFFPVICLLLLRLRRGMGMFVALLLLFVAMGPFARTIWSATEIEAEKAYFGGFDGIALGCLAALLLVRWQRRASISKGPQPGVLLACAWAGALLMFLSAAPFRWPVGRFIGRGGLDTTLLALGACIVMVTTVLRGRPGRQWTAPLRWLGRHSYEVYLTHEFVIVWITMLYVRVDGSNSHRLLLWIALMVSLCAPVGWIVAKFFSEPLNRRLRPSF